MKVEGEVGFLESGQFPKIFCDYVAGRKELKPFYDLFPGRKNFEKKIKERADFPIDRELLFSRISEQYESLAPRKAVKKNVELLKDPNTFTITTGHQLNFLSGPLFFHYKIQTVIRICQDLKKDHPKFNFVPVYWMASEDHDFEEIDHCQIGSKKHSWKTGQNGAVGRFGTTEMQKALKDIPELDESLRKVYHGGSLADATRSMVDSWYGDQGLVILDADDSELKAAFIPTMEKEIEESFLEANIQKSIEGLLSHHYKAQVNPRDINLFFLDEGYRERITRTKQGKFETADKKNHWTAEELTKLLKQNPEAFSPNVVMRPLYQEQILPNLAYVGGPSEIAYWLQLRAQFKAAKASFPILFPRISACILPKKMHVWAKDLGLTLADLFLEKRGIQMRWITHEKGDSYSLVDEFQKLEKMEGELLKQARKIDNSLIKYVGARTREMEKELERISKKFRKALERKDQEKLARIERIKGEAFPGANMQERYWNFLTLFPSDLGDLKTLGKEVDPWTFSIKMISS